MSKVFFLSLLLFLALPATLFSKSVSPCAQLLEVGEFHGADVRAQTSGDWLGLFVTKDHSTLTSLNIKVSRVFDPIVDDESKKKTGKKISIQNPTAPIFLIKNVPQLKAGKVTTVLTDFISITNETPRTINLGTQQYQLIAQPFLLGKTKVTLVQGKKKQPLFVNLHKEEGGFSIEWAGDLDGDGKLDLYVNAAAHDNQSSKRLFLSSRASKGQLVREVARFETVGC